MLHDTTPTPAVDWAAVALADLDSELDGDPVAEVGLLLSELKVAVGSEDMDVGMRIDTAVELFTAVRNEVGTVASGDAVRGSLKMSQISAMAPKVAERWLARGKAYGNDRNTACASRNRAISGQEMILQARSEVNRVFYLVDPVWYCTLYRCMHLGGRCKMCCCIGKASSMRRTLYRLRSRRTPAKTTSATDSHHDGMPISRRC